MSAELFDAGTEQKQNKSNETIAGVLPGDPMSFEEADSGHVNPKYGVDEGYAKNCQTCVPVFEARLRGYPVYARGNTPGSMSGQLSYQTNLIWIDPDTGMHPDYIYDVKANSPEKYLYFINSTVKQGERYSIQFGWKNTERAGHIVNLDRTPAGQLRIKDNQRGTGEKSEWIGDLEVLSYLSRMKYIGNNVPKLLRIDNMRFDHRVANLIMSGE